MSVLTKPAVAVVSSPVVLESSLVVAESSLVVAESELLVPDSVLLVAPLSPLPDDPSAEVSSSELGEPELSPQPGASRSNAIAGAKT
jgi:hypothetical protein